MAVESTEGASSAAASGISIPLIGEDAPPFEAVTTKGVIKFPEEYKGKWVILFSHPADFTPVCTTEFMTFASMKPKFDALNCELIGLSIDSNYSHIAWMRSIKERIEFKGWKGLEIDFPVIADLKMEVAKKYGMLQPSADDTHAIRAVFYIDPKGKMRALLYYPSANGRNFDEILRLLIALQTSDANGCATPADWRPGDDVIVPPPPTTDEAEKRVSSPEAGATCLDWFLTFRKLPKEKLTLPPGM